MFFIIGKGENFFLGTLLTGIETAVSLVCFDWGVSVFGLAVVIAGLTVVCAFCPFDLGEEEVVDDCFVGAFVVVVDIVVVGAGVVVVVVDVTKVATELVVVVDT